MNKSILIILKRQKVHHSTAAGFFFPSSNNLRCKLNQKLKPFLYYINTAGQQSTMHPSPLIKDTCIVKESQ